jgi:hypothetical protein
MTEPLLTLWVIYEKPRDFPDAWVVRPQTVHRGGAIVPSPTAVLCPSLEVARQYVPPGKVCLARDPNDDPVIVESWI